MSTTGLIAIRVYIKKIQVVLRPSTREREDGLLVPDMLIEDLIIDFDPKNDLHIDADLDVIPEIVSDIVLDFIKDNQAKKIVSSLDNSIRVGISKFFDKLYKESKLIQPVHGTNLQVAYSMAEPIKFH